MKHYCLVKVVKYRFFFREPVYWYQIVSVVNGKMVIEADYFSDQLDAITVIQMFREDDLRRYIVK